ncbi:hypothetical protein [Porcipelethomonas sp.]|uniref:hypothetical protein n=1 Tax=Porcipelethomonas sp. TaxID=2981675 RepID=UPI003EF311B4
MYCPKCGAENNNIDKYCCECGAQLWNKVKNDTKKENDIVYNKPGTIHSGGFYEMSSTVNIISRLIILVGLLCYFFTFVRISGWELIGSDFIYIGSDKVRAIGCGSNTAFFDLFIFGAAVCGVIAFWFKKGRMWLSFVAGAFLILFRIFTISLADFREIYDVLDVSFGAALYVSIIAFISAGIYLKFFDY